MSGARRRLTGRLRVGLPPSEAFRLFTPAGERAHLHHLAGEEPQPPEGPPHDVPPGVLHPAVWAEREVQVRRTLLPDDAERPDHEVDVGK